MRYHYVDASGRLVGPVEQAVLFAGVQEGTLSPEMVAAEEGSEDWRPLADVLTYYYAIDGETLGPVSFGDLKTLAATCGYDVPVLPGGSSEWMTLAEVLKPRSRQFVMKPVTIGSAEDAAPVKGLYMPDGAKIAGVIWLVFGLLKTVTVLIMIGGLSKTPVQARDVTLIVLGISLTVAVIFLLAGLRTCSGAARGTLGNGIGSVVLGGLAGCSAYAGWKTEDTFASVAMILSAAALIFAGIPAIVADGSYRAWRNSPRRR